jgi:hypothetical protein
MLAAANLPTDVRRFQQWRKKRLKQMGSHFPLPVRVGRLLKFRSTEVTQFIFERQRPIDRLRQLIEITWLEPPTEDQRLALLAELSCAAKKIFRISIVRDSELAITPRHSGLDGF